MSFDDFKDNDNPYAAPNTSEFEDAYDESPTGPVEYAGFLTRFAASFVDGIILNIIQLAVGAVIGAVLAGSGADPIAIALLSFVVNMTVFFVYTVGFLASSSMATPGKMAAGIIVTDLNGQRLSSGRALGRELGKILSGLLLMIGYLMQPFTERKQALHDIMAGTLVVKKQS